MTIGIYKITSPSNKIYIGKTKHFEIRIKQYKNLKKHNQRKLFYSFQKYGYENHKFEIIEECKFEELNEREIFWIKELNCMESGLNLSWGGDGGNWSKESIELSRLSRIKSLYQYDIEGNFIKEWGGASDAIKSIGYGNANNINDCARGKYQQTYNFRWKYKKDIQDINEKLLPILTHQPTTKFIIYINNIFKREYISWKEINKSGISHHIIKKCNISENNECIIKKNNNLYIKYRIEKIKI